MNKNQLNVYLFPIYKLCILAYGFKLKRKRTLSALQGLTMIEKKKIQIAKNMKKIRKYLKHIPIQREYMELEE